MSPTGHDRARRPVLFRGGTVYDGLGGAPSSADVFVRDGIIAAVGSGLEGDGAEVIEATGLAVAPGFIDLHSHSDLIVALPLGERQALQRCKLMQGITTEIAGNCGLGAAPRTPASADPIRSILSWMTPDGVQWEWLSFPSYLEHLEAAPLPLNTGFLAAHGPIRAMVLGLEARLADAAARGRIQALVEEALDAGAFGLSTGLIYPPGMHADSAELIAAAEPVGRAGGLLASHVRGSSETLIQAVEELIEIGERGRCSVHHSHSEAVGPAHWSKIDQVLAAEAQARGRGIRITFDLFPYHAAATMMSAIFPPWSLDGGIQHLLERLGCASERRRIRTAVETQVPAWPPWVEGGWPHNLVLACGYERIFVSRTGGRTGGRFDGLSLAALGLTRSCDPFEAIADLMIEEQGEVGQWIFGISGADGDDASLLALLRSPFGAIATDACDYGRGFPHPAAYGAFPRILARYVRERGVLDLPEAIRRMTSLPASILGLGNRGRIERGVAADLVLFDPATVADRSTFEDPRREPEGIRDVFVNGYPAVRNGTPTGIDAGRLLRRT